MTVSSRDLHDLQAKEGVIVGIFRFKQGVDVEVPCEQHQQMGSTSRATKELSPL